VFDGNTSTVDKSPLRVRRMFGEIARRYDFLNHFLSLGIDRRWRRRTVRQVPPATDGPLAGAAVLDVCTGTADLAVAYWRAGQGRVPVVGADFCRPMLEVGAEKCRRAGAAIRSKGGAGVTLVEADGQQLPFADATFQIVTVAFGLRNQADTARGLAEMARVCRPGGRVAVLEFSMPRNRVLGKLYGLYFRHVLPRVGQALARNRQEAYHYLPASVGEFPQAEAMADALRRAGLHDVRHYPLSFGIATLYVGEK
jgi:demethylmenaquinone methyltransferase/2-methoxy-6-polyprenyl-1,4-benzoquinol methylase